MIIKYSIHNQENKVIIKKNFNKVVNDELNKLNSDKKLLLVFDKNISEEIIKNIFSTLKLSGFKIYIIKLEGSKKNKTEKYLFKIIDFLLANKFTKNSIILSCGGGVVGDLTALASSLYLRGLIYCHIPTTITAIVDSCIGGKTAINYKGIINSFGNYYHSRLVFIFDEIIKKIPEREFRSGIPEILKYGLIKKNNIISILEKNKKKFLNRDFDIIQKICYESLNTKLFFFIKDEREKNERLFLNFGHTFAHAIEMSLNSNKKKDFIQHGEAVGLGILCEIYYTSLKKNKLYLQTKKILEDYSISMNLNDYIPKSINKNLLHKNIFLNIFLDKKKIGIHPRYISLKKIHNPKISEIDDMTKLNQTIFNLIN
ncbi:3-dehydroquinate synthase [Candidatus Pelagibacter sp.]|nr:3-dehydroquinate synthase [Candidatus Pelagibacter sp.]